MAPKGSRGAKSAVKSSKIPVSNVSSALSQTSGRSTAHSSPTNPFVDSPGFIPHTSGTVTPEGSEGEDFPALQSPVKPRKRRTDKDIRQQSDLQVWNMDDDTIIDASFSHLRSPVYAHFDISIERVIDSSGRRKEIVFLFTCKEDPEGHPVQRRGRMKTGSGTSNLNSTIRICDEKLGKASKAVVQSGSSHSYTYSAALHRVLAVLRCAASHRPFNMMSDPWYLVEAEMLRPGVIPPSPQMVSRDTKVLHQRMSLRVKEYFKVHIHDIASYHSQANKEFCQNLKQSIHLVLDGWTAPIIAAYLGLVIVWSDEGEIHHMILEFVRCV
ncbi:hypothetical protein NP233_g8774 [Leucocoprinus birnbaumii]|uniref:Uncharacterized protein n=1 Tax=Leucocoprinus birnbaumii TaxID=56174 RepID=A0AAD5YMU0_9AGAR|nr:hypothetical protein NP233_g8774 [Leucocoprinus birnbaumii]